MKPARWALSGTTHARDSGCRCPKVLKESGADWELIVHRIALVEGTSEEVIDNRLTRGLVDIAKLRAANSFVISDTIPYTAGSLWSVIPGRCSAAVQRHQWARGLTSAGTAGADEIAKRARMGQTQRGSFVIPILMPLAGAPPAPLKQTPITGIEVVVSLESESRRVMRTFAESLTAMGEVVATPEKEPTTDGIHNLIRAGVSHEFTSALHRILAEPAVAEFSATFEWAAGPAPAPAIAPRVDIPAAAAERIERVSEKMRKQPSRRGVEVLTGPVVGVHRADDDQSGVVTIQTVRNQRSAHVTVNVNRPLLYEAIDWMRERETVVIEGRVHRAATGLQADRTDGVSLLRSHQLE